MRDYVLIAALLAAFGATMLANRRGERIDALTAERDTAIGVAAGYKARAELDRLIADAAKADAALTAARMAEIQSRTPERVTVYRDRVRVIEPMPAVCGPGAGRVAAVNEALR